MAGLLLLQATAFAEPAEPGLDFGLRSTLPEDVPNAPSPASATPACGPRAALFTTGGIKVWVTRKGSIRWHNPLRPLAPETLRVLQVSVNGRLGSAYGPDFDHLRQGSAPRDLEEGNPEPIRWDAEIDDMPSEIRVVAEDGAVLLGPMRFQDCGDAPRATAPRAAAREGRPVDEMPLTGAPASSRARQSGRPGLPMPQGAIR